MKLFKKKIEKSCCSSCREETMGKALLKHNEGSRIKVLGSGCSKCITLKQNVQVALRELEENLKIDYITDFTEVASYGVMSTPALVIDDKVVSFGKVLNKDEIIVLLNDAGF